MDDKSPDWVKRPPSLASAIRAARVDEAERSQAVVDLRGAEMARLDLLRDALQPVLAQIPEDVEMFDAGLVPGEHPRLFIDMIAFVEMGRDRRTYRFLQDTRHGRALLFEDEGLHAALGAVTRYIARRLVEREKALASLGPDGVAAMPDEAPARQDSVATVAEEPSRRAGFGGFVVRGLRLGIDGLGVLTLAGLVWLGMQYMQGRLSAW